MDQEYDCLILDILSEVQTALAAAVGFGGVILTMWWNGRAARTAAAARITHEAKALRRILWSELMMLREEIDGVRDVSARVAEGDAPHDILVPIARSDFGFSGVHDRIGVLDLDELPAILRGYRYYRAFLNGVRVIGEPSEVPDHWRVPAGRAQELWTMAHSLGGELDLLVSFLEERAG